MANVFMERRKRIEVLEALDKELDNLLKGCLYDYQCVKETVTDEQDRNWRTDELLWEDDEHTIPKMKVNREYDYVRRPDETLTDEDHAFQKAVEDVRKCLIKMLG